MTIEETTEWVWTHFKANPLSSICMIFIVVKKTGLDV